MISYASSRFRNGQTATCSPSRFIRDINPKYLQLSNGSNISGRTLNTPVNNYRSSLNTRSYSQPKQTSFSKYESENKSTRYSDYSTSKSTQSTSNGIHSVSELSEGMKIEHSRFGTGVISKIDHQSPDPRIIVAFDNVGEKTLLLKFAKFNIIG